MKYEVEVIDELKRELARVASQQRALKNERREAWRAPRAEPAPDARCRAASREVTRGASRVRALHLAYAFVRDRPLWTHERRAADRIGGLVGAVAEAARTPVEEVRAWIDRAMPDEVRLAFEAHQAGVRTRAIARRASRRAARESSS